MKKVIKIGDIVTPKTEVKYSYVNGVCRFGEPCEVISTPIYTNKKGTFLYCRSINGGHEIHCDRNEMKLF